MTWGEIVQDPIVVGVAAAVIAVVVIALVVWMAARRRRRDRLQRRFGAEYKRTVDERGSRRLAEQDLGQRRERRDSMEVRTLTLTEREEARARFEEIQASFVDGPESAVRFADHLLEEVAEQRGYEDADGGRLAAVSVDHPEDTAVHRRRTAMLDGDRRLDTEDLRQAMLSARRLLERLVREGEDGQPSAPAPPPSLLGLHEEDDAGEPTHEVDADRPDAERGEDSDDDVRGEGGSGLSDGEAATLGTRSDQHGRVTGTVDLTEPERSSEPGPR